VFTTHFDMVIALLVVCEAVDNILHRCDHNRGFCGPTNFESILLLSIYRYSNLLILLILADSYLRNQKCNSRVTFPCF